MFNARPNNMVTRKLDSIQCCSLWVKYFQMFYFSNQLFFHYIDHGLFNERFKYHIVSLFMCLNALLSTTSYQHSFRYGNRVKSSVLLHYKIVVINYNLQTIYICPTTWYFFFIQNRTILNCWKSYRPVMDWFQTIFLNRT